METTNLKDVKNFDYGIEKIFKEADDFLPINGTDYVELYVGNAKQAAHYYKTAFGFQALAYAGLETGSRDRTSYVLVQDKIRLVLTTPMTPNSEIAEHIKQHGDGVKVIALWVDDARKAFNETVSRGAMPYFEPVVEQDEHGEVGDAWRACGSGGHGSDVDCAGAGRRAVAGRVIWRRTRGKLRRSRLSIAGCTSKARTSRSRRWARCARSQCRVGYHEHMVSVLRKSNGLRQPHYVR
ncbi:MAG: hypothetical protein EBZ77_01380 [Chitinophagia bacterium]|nr:hypothetical protein [Chitinophagia bacterium]